MHRTPILATVGLLALAATTFAAPAKPHEAWASGRIERVDTSAKSLVVTQGTHEMTFVLAADAHLTQGKKSVTPAELGGDVGRAVEGALHDQRHPADRRPRGGRRSHAGAAEDGGEEVARRPGQAGAVVVIAGVGLVASSGAGRTRLASGSDTTKVLPCPSDEVTDTWPPCASTTALTSDRPRPRPRAERLASAR